MAELRKRAEEHFGKGVPEKVYLLELGWCTKEVIVTYVQYERCGEGYYVVRKLNSKPELSQLLFVQ